MSLLDMPYIFPRGALSGYVFPPVLRVSLFVRSPAMSMSPIGKEATSFVRACEAIHGLLAQGTLTPDDRDLIVFSGSELLSTLRPG